MLGHVESDGDAAYGIFNNTWHYNPCIVVYNDDWTLNYDGEMLYQR